jgi:dihydropteroate synthase
LDWRINSLEYRPAFLLYTGDALLTQEAQIVTRTSDIIPTSPSELVLPRNRRLQLDRPLVMGILNVTPDSFSDGGRFVGLKASLGRARTMLAQGADIIDIGGESTRPGAMAVSEAEELERVTPVIAALRSESDIPISIDTYKAAIAEAALEAGADIVNDVSALRFDDRLAAVVAAHGVPVILMHMLGEPRNMQLQPSYNDCVGEIAEFFAERIAVAERAGIDRKQIILDPGIGFGKRLVDNLDILAQLNRFRTFQLPLLIGASRKSFIKMVHDTGDGADSRIGGSLAAALVAARQSVEFLRVHDVAPTVEALAVFRAIEDRT